MTRQDLATLVFNVLVPHWLRHLRLIWKLAALSFVFCAITLSVLFIGGAKEAKAQQGGAHVQVPRTQPQPPDQSNAGSPARAVSGVLAQANQGVIYAPRDVVDMSRLVLEVSRDNTEHLAHYIELGTTVIVVFFTLLGALGAAFGLHKMDDMDKKVAAWEREYRAKMESSVAILRLEIVNQNELMTAKLEIEKALRMTDAETMNRQLRFAISRIEKALASEHLPATARLRGLADLAFAAKRLADVDKAFTSVCKAIELSVHEDLEAKSRALLNYNAACYACLLKKRSECLERLVTAIHLNEDYKVKAGADDDFVWLRGDADFQALLK